MSADNEPDRNFYGKGNPVMEIMFAGFVEFAWVEPGFREAFEASSGMKLATDGLSAEIDKATGYRGAYMEAFIRWLIVNHWGEGKSAAAGGAGAKANG